MCLSQDMFLFLRIFRTMFSGCENVLFLYTSKNLLRLGRQAASLHTTHDSSAVKQSSSGVLDNTVSAIHIFLSDIPNLSLFFYLKLLRSSRYVCGPILDR